MTEASKEIEDLEDIKLLVNTFYDRVRKDALIGPVFNDKIGDNWPVHLEKMYGFWRTILLNEHHYSGSPFKAHMPLDIDERHFERWQEIFEKTVNSLFKGERAEEAKTRAKNMGLMFSYKLKHMKDHGF